MPMPFVISETADLDAVSVDTVSVDPGEKTTLAEYEVRGQYGRLVALEMLDDPDATWSVHLDHDQMTETHDPLGSFGDPLSLLDDIGVTPWFEDLVQVKVRVSSSAGSSKDLKARIYTTE